MCGIVGHVGSGNSADILIEGLKRLEYRGYDSSGIAVLNNGQIAMDKAVGKLQNLITSLEGNALSGSIGIGHTRWATHGGVTHANAHPHKSADEAVIVHNGIIENFRELRAELQASGHKFTSDTDSEVVSHLCVELAKSYNEPAALLKALLARLEGSYALCILMLSLIHI